MTGPDLSECLCGWRLDSAILRCSFEVRARVGNRITSGRGRNGERGIPSWG